MTYTVTLEEDEAAEIRRRAIERGYASLEDYLRALIAADALVDDSPTKAELLDDIRDGILAVKRGDVMPTLDELWDDLDD